MKKIMVIIFTLAVVANLLAINDMGKGGSFDGSAMASSGVFDMIDDSTLPVELSSFTAVQTSNFARINWITQSETDLLGYNVYREETGNVSEGLRVNSSIITAMNQSITTSYSFTDEEVEMDHTYFYWLESIELDGTTDFHGPVSVTLQGGGGEDDPPEIPMATALSQNYPNPFNPTTTIRFSVKEDEVATLEIFNLKGQKVQSYSEFTSGSHSVTWNGKDGNGDPIASGVYFYKLKTDSFLDIKKMLLMK